MRIDPEYGPQFDHLDGTIGETQCVRRWVIKRGPGLFDWFAPYRQGRYTYATREECETDIAMYANNPTNDPKLVAGLFAEEWWCYPVHFDPVSPVGFDPEKPPTYQVGAMVRRVGAIGIFYPHTFTVETWETDPETILDAVRAERGADWEFNWIGSPSRITA